MSVSITLYESDWLKAITLAKTPTLTNKHYGSGGEPDVTWLQRKDCYTDCTTRGYIYIYISVRLCLYTLHDYMMMHVELIMI